MVRLRSAMLGAVCALSVGIIAGCSCGDCGGGSTVQQVNPVLDNIMTRTSIRQYQPGRTVPADTVEILLKAAMAAPTAVNRQPWTFVVIDDRSVLDSLMAVCPNARMLGQASMAIVTCGDMERALEGEAREFWVKDVSAATENLLLAAHALDLGAVWTGVYPSSERVLGVRRVLRLPENIVPLALVPVGYPAVDPEPKDKWDPDKVVYNRWTDSVETE